MYYPSVKEEYVEPIDAQVKGTIPPWLSGSLVRVGPGLLEIGDCHFNHLFDGMAKVHKFTIKNGGVTYQSRFIQSQTYKKNTEANRIVVHEFGTVAMPDPCKNIFQRMASKFESQAPTDNTVVNVFPIGDSLYSASEVNVIHRIDQETLDTMSSVDISKLVAVNSATAHPHTEKDGTVYNFGMIYKEGKYAIIKLTPEGEKIGTAEILGTVTGQSRLKPSYFHSFGVTENYIVMVESPLIINVLKMMLVQRVMGKPLSGALEWNPKVKTLFHIMDKHTGKLVNQSHTYTSDAFFAFHHANAYEENGNLIVDLCAFTDGSVIQKVDLKFLQDPANKEALLKLPVAHGLRYAIPLELEGKKEGDQLVEIPNCSASAVVQKKNHVHLQPHQMAESAFEFPRINYNFNGKKYRYLYGVASCKTNLDLHLYRLDTESGEELRWVQDGYTASEPVFVANPAGQAEDDGVLLSIALSPDPANKAFLVIVDGSNMAELARAEVDVMVHRDFHGNFFSADSYQF